MCPGIRSAALGAAAVLGAFTTCALAARPAPPPAQYHRVETRPGPGGVSVTSYDISNDGVSVGEEMLGATSCTTSNTRAVIHGPLSPASPAQVTPSFEDDPGPSPALSGALAATQDGSMVAGWLRVPRAGGSACSTIGGPALWERCGTTWCRSWIEDPTLLDSNTGFARGIEIVGGTPIAAGYGASPATTPRIWRRIGSSWVGESLPMLGLTEASGGDIQDDGLVLTHFGEVPAVWDCSGPACSAAILLPSAGFAWMRAFDINDEGDVVGEGMPSGTTDFHAVIWRFHGLSSSAPWSDPVLLPDFGSPSGAYASEWNGGLSTLTVVGGARKGRKGNAVRWRSNGTTWSAPEKLDELDDSSTAPSIPDHLSATGHLGGASDAEIRR